MPHVPFLKSGWKWYLESCIYPLHLLCFVSVGGWSYDEKARKRSVAYSQKHNLPIMSHVLVPDDKAFGRVLEAVMHEFPHVDSLLDCSLVVFKTTKIWKQITNKRKVLINLRERLLRVCPFWHGFLRDSRSEDEIDESRNEIVDGPIDVFLKVGPVEPVSQEMTQIEWLLDRFERKDSLIARLTEAMQTERRLTAAQIAQLEAQDRLH